MARDTLKELEIIEPRLPTLLFNTHVLDFYMLLCQSGSLYFICFFTYWCISSYFMCVSVQGESRQVVLSLYFIYCKGQTRFML